MSRCSMGAPPLRGGVRQKPSPGKPTASGGPPVTRVLTYVCLIALMVFTFTAVDARGEDHIDLVKKGNEAFAKADYKKALEYYHGAETELPESPELDYNIAGALYKDGGYEQAVDKYTKALNTTDINLEASAHYNLGNTYFRMEDYQTAIQSYENALSINPNDMDAKYNLELARKMLKEQMQQEQQQQQEQNQQQQQQDQQQQDQQEQDQQQQDQQEQDQQQQQDDQQQDQQQQQKQEQKEMSKEDAERILNALRDDEQDIQKKIKRQIKAGNYTGKDW